MNEALFAENDLVRNAVERCLERICEAAAKLGDMATQIMPEQPWQKFAPLETFCGISTTISSTIAFSTSFKTTFLACLLRQRPHCCVGIRHRVHDSFLDV
jgi:hypothetical protein